MAGGLQITQPFDNPYNTSTAALPSTFSPSVVGINGIPYLIDTRSGNYRREGFDVVQQRNTDSQRDLLLLPQDVWRQQMQSWHQGAGQSNTDRDDSLQYRFDKSFGIDPWTKWRLSLLPSTSQLFGTSSLSGSTFLTTYDQYLAVVNGTTILWYDELSVGSTASAGSTAVNVGYPVIDIADMGAYVTTLHNDGKVYETSGPGATPALKGTYTNANFIAYEKDFLIAGITNDLRDITAGGAGTLIYTSPLPDFRWVSAASGDSCIYVLGGSGEKYVVHRVNISQDGTGLLPAIVAATLPDGEIGYSIQVYLGFVMIGTNKGIRLASMGNNGDLTLGPIIPADAPVRCFEGQDRFVWYGVSSMDGAYSLDTENFPSAPVSGLGRLDLSVTTTSALTPAYANDICVVGSAASVTRSVVTFGDKRVFSVDGNGVWFENSTYMAGGWCDQGTMSFSVEDVKTGLYVQAKWEPLDGEVALDIAYDSSGYIRLASFDQPDSIRSGNVSLDGVQYSRIDSRVVLFPNSNSTLTPRFTRWEHRAIPVKGRASRWTIPIFNYEDIEIDMVKYTTNPLNVYQNLIYLVESGIIFTLQESGVAYQVHAKDFTWQPEKLTENGKAWQGVFTLVVESVQ